MCNGGNDYKIPHINKDKMIRQLDRLPPQISMSSDALERCKEWNKEEEDVEIDRLAIESAEWEAEERRHNQLVQQLEEWDREEEEELEELAKLLEEEHQHERRVNIC